MIINTKVRYVGWYRIALHVLIDAENLVRLDDNDGLCFVLGQ